MTDATSAAAMQGQQAQWFYALAGQRCGPLTSGLLRNMIYTQQLPLDVYVWREGMTDWLPARAVPELTTGMGLSEAMLRTPEEHRQFALRRSTAVNAVVMFVMFIISLGYVVAVLALDLWERRGVASTAPSVFFGFVCIASQVFAAIYLPLRWRQLRSASPGIRTVGFIGGIGLAVLLVVSILMIALSMADRDTRRRRPKPPRRRTAPRTFVEPRQPVRAGTVLRLAPRSRHWAAPGLPGLPGGAGR